MSISTSISISISTFAMSQTAKSYPPCFELPQGDLSMRQSTFSQLCYDQSIFSKCLINCFCTCRFSVNGLSGSINKKYDQSTTLVDVKEVPPYYIKVHCERNMIGAVFDTLSLIKHLNHHPSGGLATHASVFVALLQLSISRSLI